MFRKVFFILCASMLMSMTSSVFAELGLKRMVITSPTKGEIFYRSNAEITNSQVQWLQFDFHTGDLFSQNQGAHLFVALDGDLKELPRPMRGRGIAFGNTYSASGCYKMAFEHFGGDTSTNPPGNSHPGGCGNNVTITDDTWYRFYITATTNGLEYQLSQYVNGSWVLQDTDSTYAPSLVTGQSDIFIGMAGDQNTSTYTIQNLVWGPYQPWQ